MKKKVRIILKFLGYLGLAFCAAELISRVIVPTSLTRQISSPHMFESDLDIGYRLRRNMITHVRAWNGHTNLFQVRYETDEYGRRIVPVPNRENRDQHFIILGGSTVFGMGLKDSDTLAHFLAAGTHQVMPYNYAGDGYGPQNAYAIVKAGLLQKEVPEENGHTVFFLQVLNQTGGHIQTLLGRFELLLDGWGESLPMYEIEPGQPPRAVGTLSSINPLKFQIVRFLQNFHVINLLYPKLVPVSDIEIQKTVEFMLAMRDEVRVAKPNSHFHIVIHPLSDRHATPPITNALLNAGLSILDESRLVDETRRKDYIAFSRYFPHPNGRLNDEFAKALIEQLKLK